MNSKRKGGFATDRGAEPERAFLVGVEFLAHGYSGRETRRALTGKQQSAAEDHPSDNYRNQASGKVPPSARAARTVADSRLHATEIEHSAFSAEESMAE